LHDAALDHFLDGEARVEDCEREEGGYACEVGVLATGIVFEHISQEDVLGWCANLHARMMAEESVVCRALPTEKFSADIFATAAFIAGNIPIAGVRAV
jgi:hypothetical protein